MVAGLYAATLAVLVVTSSPSLAPADQPSSEKQNPTKEVLYVTLELTLEDGSPASVSVPEGGLAFYENRRLGFKIGVVPRISDLAGGDIDLEIFSVKGSEGSYRRDRRLETVAGKVGFEAVSSALSAPFEVRVSSIGALADARRDCASLKRASSNLEVATEEQNNWGMGCCVACGGEMICGCAVSSRCGSCCDCFGCVY